MSDLDGLIAWLQPRPAIWLLVEAFPPLCYVKTKPGVQLLAPAPGVEGQVVSYIEPASVRVKAPMQQTLTSPITGNTVVAGEEIAAECAADDLVLVRATLVTLDEVKSAIHTLSQPTRENAHEP